MICRGVPGPRTAGLLQERALRLRQNRVAGGLLAIWEPIQPGAALLDPDDYETCCIAIKARGLFV